MIIWIHEWTNIWLVAEAAGVLVWTVVHVLIYIETQVAASPSTTTLLFGSSRNTNHMGMDYIFLKNRCSSKYHWLDNMYIPPPPVPIASYKQYQPTCVGYDSNHGCVVPWLVRHRHRSSQCCLTESASQPPGYVVRRVCRVPTSKQDLHLHLAVHRAI